MSAKNGAKLIIAIVPPIRIRWKGLIRGSVISLSKPTKGFPWVLGNQERIALAIIAHSKMLITIYNTLNIQESVVIVIAITSLIFLSGLRST
jgi:hypothetical protein